nr:MFS transporter [uncultured Dongia sp.]
MSGSSASSGTAGQPGLMGWLVVGLGFIALSVGFSARSNFGLAMEPMEKELGWSRTGVSDAATWALVIMATMAPFAGNLVDRFGPRLLLGGGLVALGVGMLGTSIAQNGWQFYLAYSLLAAIGFGTVATHVVSTAVSYRFSERQGLAVGIATSGSSAGQFLILPIVALVLTAYGWRASYVVLGLVCLALAPIVFFLLRNEGTSRASRNAVQLDSLPVRLSRLAKSGTFQLLFWSFFICGFTTTGIIETHFLPFAATCGFPPQESTTAYVLLSAINLAGMVFAGWLTDRMNRPLLLGAIYIARAFSFLILLVAAEDINLLFGFAVVFGVFDYSTVPPTASLVASHLGMKVMGLAMGLLSAGHALGGAVGVFLAARIFDWSAKYDWVWLVAFGLAILAGLMSFAIRENRAKGLLPAHA